MSAVSMEQKRHTYQLAASVMRPTNLPWGMTGVCLQADVRDKLEKSLTCQLVLKRVRDEDTLCSLLHCTDQGNQSYTGEKGICNSALSQDAINIKVGGITIDIRHGTHLPVAGAVQQRGTVSVHQLGLRVALRTERTNGLSHKQRRPQGLIPSASQETCTPRAR